MGCDLLKLEQRLPPTSPPEYVCLGPALNTRVLPMAQLANGREAPHARQLQGGQSKLDLAMDRPKNRAENQWVMFSLALSLYPSNMKPTP